jgi:GxxExxY protein
MPFSAPSACPVKLYLYLTGANSSEAGERQSGEAGQAFPLGISPGEKTSCLVQVIKRQRSGRLQGFKAMNFRDLTYKINGAIYEVHRTLGEGFLERVYENALLYELQEQGLKAESQVPIPVYYKKRVVGDYLADLIVEDEVILKTVDELSSIHQAQLLNYLKATGKHLGLLVNFKGKKATIRRLALEENNEPG